MPDLGDHASFILIAYALTVLVVAGLVGWVVIEYRSLTARLAALEARGVRRRSAAQATTEPSP